MCNLTNALSTSQASPAVADRPVGHNPRRMVLDASIIAIVPTYLLWPDPGCVQCLPKILTYVLPADQSLTWLSIVFCSRPILLPRPACVPNMPHSSICKSAGRRMLPDLCMGCSAGNQLGLIDTHTSSMTVLDTGFSNFGKLAVAQPGLQEGDGSLIIVTTAGSASQAPAVVCLRVSCSQR